MKAAPPYDLIAAYKLAKLANSDGEHLLAIEIIDPLSPGSARRIDASNVRTAVPFPRMQTPGQRE